VIQAMRFQREEAAALSEKSHFPTILINPPLPRSPMTTVIPPRKKTNRAVYRSLLSCVTIRWSSRSIIYFCLPSSWL